MIVEHLDSYQIALIAWTLLFAIVGIQGFLSTFMEGDTEKTDYVKNKQRAPIFVVGLMMAVVVVDIYLAWSFVQQLYGDASPQILARSASLMSLSLAALFVLYRRYFMEDVVISQDRDDDVPW